MSWFARSIANSLGLDDDEDDSHQTDPNIAVANQRNPEYDPQSASPSSNSHSSQSSASNTPRGVKEDLSELSKTLTRQFWGVASFLAPPPPPDLPNQQGQSSENENSDEVMISGIRNDFAEIGGKFRTGISNLSSNIAVSEITKIASNLLQFGSEEDSLDKYEVGNVIGLTEEVLAFARDIAMHPETWLDFPFPDDVDFDDLDMSDVQQEHALSVEQVAPRLAALRMEICPGYMSENCFWKIYFVLVHPRLSKHDAELLSTPQILEAREMLSYKLQKGTEAKAEENRSESPSDSDKSVDLQSVESRSIPSGLFDSPSASAPSKTSDLAPSTVTVDFETEKYPVQTSEMEIVDKSVIEEDSGFQTKPQYSTFGTSRVLDEKSDDDVDDWLKEENSDIAGTGETSVPLGNDEDVSFSDLEEEDDGDVPVSYKKVTSGSDSSVKDSRDWVQVGRSSTDSVKDISSIGESRRASGQVSARNSETKDSSDWLDVDDIDVM